MRRGDVVAVNLPFPTTPGHEQAGRRPAIVVQADGSTPATSTVLLVPLTSRQAALRFPHCILIPPSASNGLSVASVALVSQLRAIDKSRVERTLGQLEPHFLQAIDAQLHSVIGI